MYTDHLFCFSIMERERTVFLNLRGEHKVHKLREIFLPRYKNINKWKWDNVLQVPLIAHILKVSRNRLHEIMAGVVDPAEFGSRSS
jgi:hypothetical protein